MVLFPGNKKSKNVLNEKLNIFLNYITTQHFRNQGQKSTDAASTFVTFLF